MIPSPDPNRRRRGARVCLALLIATLLTSGVQDAAAQSQQSPVVLGRSGWEAIRAGRVDDAADAFRQALALAPREPTLLLGAGLAAHLLGQPADARQALEQALQASPRLTDASLLLGQITHRQGDVHTAIRTYEDALTYAPENRILQERLHRWRREAAVHDVLDRRGSDHFTILFEGETEQALAERALQNLETAYWRIGDALGTYPTEPIQVVLYAQQQFRDITRAPAWSAGAFDGTIRVPVRDALANPAELDRVLSHELAHAFVWSIARRGVPKWLDEGLAVVFEAHSRTPGSHRPNAPRAEVPLARLHDSFAHLSGLEAADAYAQSGSATGALLDLIGGAGVASLLTDLGAGADFGSAFAQRASLSYAAFQHRWPELAATGEGTP